jgi:hypothetical protein
MVKMTKPQKRLLTALLDGPITAGFLRRGLHRTMYRLVDLGFVGFRRNEWKITPSGRAALSTQPGESK